MKDDSAVQVFRGEIFYLVDDPARSAGDEAYCHHQDGLLVVKDGKVSDCLPAAESELAQGAVRLSGLIVPGMVDTHVHYPQLDVLAAPGTQLLEWLERYTFPTEAAFSDAGHARREAVKFLDAMLAAGTTTALVFATSHAASAQALFAEAQRRELRLVTGKVLSDRNVPEELRDSPEAALEESAALIAEWHGQGRLGYAVTPRFAPTSSPEQLAVAGRLLAEHPSVLLHTHMSENHAEIEWVRKLYPSSTDYLDVYERAGLATDRSVFAHSIHLSQREWGALERTGASVSFCPCSNLFLGSGLFDTVQADLHGVPYGLGSDVGGGNKLSMLGVMEDAYKVARTGGGDIDPLRLWYLATLGGARALGLGDCVGSLQPGYEADFVVLNPGAISLLANRVARTRDLAEKLFAIALLGDERIVSEVYVLGKKTAGADC